jgi:hypothetical protein
MASMDFFRNCICSLSFILGAALIASSQQAPPLPPEQIHEIIIHNRILTRVNEKNITVLDVVKQMDVFLRQNLPHYLESNTARYHFYKTHWRTSLQQLIDNELMAADAESKEIKISDGDVREEIQARFGPNVMKTLDQLGLSYEEARKHVHQEMLVQKIQGFRVTSKVLQKVSSQTIKDAYQQFVHDHPPKNLWKYQFVTIRSADPTLSETLISLKEKSGGDLATAIDLLTADQQTTVSLSQEFETEDKSLSQTHREILAKLKQGDWSLPASQSGHDGTTTLRIFHLKAHTHEKPPAFTTLANNLRMQLLNHIADEEMQTYRAKLYKRFNFDDQSLDIPPQFEPFTPR